MPAAPGESAGAPRTARLAPANIRTQVSGGRIQTLINVGEADEIQIAPERRTAAELQDQGNRSRMLERVRRTWISGYLHDSLHGAALLPVGLKDQPDAVADRWGPVLPALEEAPRELSSDTSIVDVFDDRDGELVILGEPGAGKTVLLLELADTLLVRATQDETLPIPVVLPLAPWARNRQSLEEWLVAELDARYDVPRQIGRAWIAGERILPLLGGLDEVGPAYREACIAAINQFLENRARSLVRLALTCRVEDYAPLAGRLRLRGAVVLEPLRPDQVDAYLAGAGEQVANLRTALQLDTTLRELATSPLMLCTMALAYQGASVETLPTKGTLQARRTQLLATYVESMFRRRATVTKYTNPQAKHWLMWLGRALIQESQSALYLERLQPEWLPTRSARAWYWLTDRVGFAVLIGLVAGLASWLLTSAVDQLSIDFPTPGTNFELLWGAAMMLCTAALAGLIGGTDVREDRLRAVASGIIAALLGVLLGGLSFGVASLLAWGYEAAVAATVNYGVPIGFMFGLSGAIAGGPGLGFRRVVLIEVLHRSAFRTVASFLFGGIVGLIESTVYGGGFDSYSPAWGWFASPLLGPPGALGSALGLGILFGVLFGVGSGQLDQRKIVVPNQGIHRSFRRATIVALTTYPVLGVVSALAFGLRACASSGLACRGGLPTFDNTIPYGVLVGLLFAILGFLVCGGYACISHVALRIALWRAGVMPVDAIDFLDYATDRILLRRVGGGYAFVHRLLQEYFASLELESQSADV